MIFMIFIIPVQYSSTVLLLLLVLHDTAYPAVYVLWFACFFLSSTITITVSCTVSSGKNKHIFLRSHPHDLAHKLFVPAQRAERAPMANLLPVRPALVANLVAAPEHLRDVFRVKALEADRTLVLA